MEEKDKDFEVQPQADTPADEDNTQDTVTGTDGVKYEENDNWQFDAEAPTLSDDIFASKDFEVDTDALKVEKPVQPQQRSGDIVINREKVGFTFLAIIVACIIALLVFLGVRYNTVPNGKEGRLMNPASVVATVDDTKISIGMFNYYYSNIVNYYETYASSFGLDTSSDYETQYTTDEDGNQVSWMDFLENTTLDEIKTTVALYNKGVENGITLNSTQTELVEDYIENAKANASSEGISLDEYLTGIYGDYCTEETLRLFYDQYFISANYQGYCKAQQSVTDEEIEKYFNDNKYDYYQINFCFAAVEYDSTDEDTKAESQAVVDDYMSKITDRDSILDLVPSLYSDYIEQDIETAMSSDDTLTEDQARQQAIETYQQSIDGTISGGSAPFGEDINDWIFSDDTPIGSKTYYIDDSIGYAYIILKTEAPTLIEDPTYAVRHILIQPKADEAEQDAETEDTESTTTEETEEYTDEQWAAAEASAQDILKEFENGDKSELSFALLAEKYSEDPGISSYYGGLYEGVTEGYMQPEFEEWSMDESRQYGDTGIVKTDYGYHIMFFVYQEPSYKAEIIYQVNYDKMKDSVSDTVIKTHSSVLEKTIDTFYSNRDTASDSY